MLDAVLKRAGTKNRALRTLAAETAARLVAAAAEPVEAGTPRFGASLRAARLFAVHDREQAAAFATPCGNQWVGPASMIPRRFLKRLAPGADRAVFAAAAEAAGLGRDARVLADLRHPAPRKKSKAPRVPLRERMGQLRVAEGV